jgi:hypothetical protein
MTVCAAAVSRAVMKSAAARPAGLPLDLSARSASTSPRAAILQKGDPGEEEAFVDIVFGRAQPLRRFGQPLRAKQLELETAPALSRARQSGPLDQGSMLPKDREDVLTVAGARFSRLLSRIGAVLALARIFGEERSSVGLERPRLIGGLRLRGGRGLERPKLCRERLHREGSVDGRRPNAAARGVDHDQSGAALSECETLLAKQRVNVVPGAVAGEESGKRRLDFLLHPGRERALSAMGLEIRGAPLRPAFERAAMIGARQAVLDLQFVAGLHQLALVVIGLDAAQCGRIDLVDRYVQVQMRPIEMQGRNPLVARQADRGAEFVLDGLDLRGRWPLPRLKRHHKMIGSIAAASLVEALRRQDLHDRERRRVGVAVRDAQGADAAACLIGEDVIECLIGCCGLVSLLALAKDVGAEPAEIGGSLGTHHTLRDHDPNQPDA